jgi:hypothetical protein
VNGVAFVAPYGSALNPLLSVEEPCPECGAPLAAGADVDGRQIQLAALLLEPEERRHWSRICAVVCPACRWVGSAFRETVSLREAA